MSSGTVVLIVIVVVVLIAVAVLVPLLRRRGRTRGASASAKLPALGQMGANPNAAPKDHNRTPADPPAPPV